MSEAILHLKTREKGKHSVLTQLRLNKHIPVVLYKRGTETISLDMEIAEYERVTKGHNRNQVLQVIIDNNEAAPQKVIVRDIQRHPVKRTLRHIDFQGLDGIAKVKVKVPIHFIGEAVGVKTEGGVLQHVLHRVLIETTPDDIPEKIDVSHML